MDQTDLRSKVSLNIKGKQYCHCYGHHNLMDMPHTVFFTDCEFDVKSKNLVQKVC